MKNYSKWLAGLTVFAVLFGSCKKEENKDYYAGGTAPVLSASDTAISLIPANASADAITVTWTNPQYRFTTGISSLNVNYALEIDTLGANFTSPKKFTVTVAGDLSKTFTVTELNSDLSNAMDLSQDTPHTIQMRVVSSLGSYGSATLSSNMLQYTVTPYSPPPVVIPPDSKTLYITGAATPGNWQCGCGEAELVSQKFERMSNTLYVLPSIALTGGQSYTFVPVYGSWSAKYSIKKKNDPDEVNGGPFQAGGEDILAPSASGNYKIEVDFQKGIFTVTKL